MQFIDSTGLLPEPLKRAIKWQMTNHSKGDADLSCTGLIDSPLMAYLFAKHDDQIVIEYASKLWPLYGSITHEIVSRFGVDDDTEHVEQQVFATFDGFRVSGRYDYLKSTTGLFSDYKLTSGYAVMKGLKKEWSNQENTYLCLMRHSDDPAVRALAEFVKQLQIVALIRDYGPRMKPQLPVPVAIVPVPIWPDEQAVDYIHERIAIHRAASATNTIPEQCSESERWISPELYAIEKPGRKSSVKNFKLEDYDNDTEKAKQAAEDFIAHGGKGTDARCTAVLRKTEPKRCQKEYCNVFDYCPYRQNENENENEQEGW